MKNLRYPRDWDIGGKINREKDEWSFEISRVFEISVHNDLNSIWTTKQNVFTMAVYFSNLQVLPPTRLGCSWHQCRCGRYHWSVHHTCCCLLFHEIPDTDPINQKPNTAGLTCTCTNYQITAQYWRMHLINHLRDDTWKWILFCLWIHLQVLKEIVLSNTTYMQVSHLYLCKDFFIWKCRFYQFDYYN